MHTTQKIGLGNKSKVDSTLRWTADSASCSTNPVNLMGNLASYNANSVKLVADPAKSCCSCNNVSNTSTADSAISYNSNSDTPCANKNSEYDYLTH